MKKLIGVNLAVGLFLIAIFDVASYLLLPERMLAPFPEYRRDPLPSDPLAVGWPRGYYTASATRGFDLGARRSARYWVDGTAFPIWTNSLGCFDREHEEDSAYVYLAGDSFTWGYGAYEDKFGTLVEAATGTPIFKCGVEHTGQRHQFEKFLEIVARTHALPRAVFVFHFENDVANDYAFPQSTVVDGWLIDAVAANAAHELIHRSPKELSRRIASRLRDAAAAGARDSIANRTLSAHVGRLVKRYSMSANLLRAIRRAGPERKTATVAGPAADTAQLNLYTIPYVFEGAYWYLENPYAVPNRRALLEFKAWSDEHGVPLVVVMIPRRRERFDPSFYAQLDTFLDRNGIRHLDLASVFAAMRLRPGDLYWRTDPHFNRRGNAMVAQVLLDSFPVYLGTRRNDQNSK